MITQELTGYVRAELAKGKTREEIRKVLLAGGGWNEIDVDQVFRAVDPISSINSNISNLNTPKVFTPTFTPKLTPTPTPIPILTPKPTPTPTPTPTPIPILTPKPTPTFIPTPTPILTPKPTPTSTPTLVPTPTPAFIPNIFPPIEIKPKEIPGESSFQINKDVDGETIMGTHKIIKDTAFVEPKVSLWKKIILVVLVLGAFILLWYFYPQVTNLFNSLTQKTISMFPAPTPIVQNTVQPDVSNNENPIVPTNVAVEIKDCGATSAPDLNSPTLYGTNPVFACLGQSALNCVNAKALLQNTLFPTVFEIVSNGSTCDFKLSYAADSTLIDIKGNKLAGQSIECPLNIVKAIDNTKIATPKFIAPDKIDLGKYASQIYFYGTVGVFVENNLDINKIASVGCSGNYIQSMIDSYKISTTPQ